MGEGKLAVGRLDRKHSGSGRREPRSLHSQMILITSCYCDAHFNEEIEAQRS